MKYLYSFVVLFGFVLIEFLSFTPVLAASVEGIMLMTDGTPMAGGKTIIFDAEKGPPPQLDGDGRYPDFTADLDKKGAFKISLTAGTYYFGAVQWGSGRGPGKPERGDNFFLLYDHPIKVSEEGNIDLGIIARGEPIE